MIEISNLRKYSKEGFTRLEANIDFTGFDASRYTEKTIFFSISEENGDMLADDSYDAFVLVPLYLAMYHKTDLRIHGNISKKLYNNINWYIQRIFCNFSDDLAPTNVIVDGFTNTPPLSLART